MRQGNFVGRGMGLPVWLIVLRFPLLFRRFCAASRGTGRSSIGAVSQTIPYLAKALLGEQAVAHGRRSWLVGRGKATRPVLVRLPRAS